MPGLWLGMGLVVPLAACAMNLPHYDLESLVYMSTDVVTATVSVRPEHKFVATVTGAVYGSIAAGDRLETLSDFLGFFQPMEDGQRVILFLDRRPRAPNFLYPEASKSPFAVAPSGVYLIDVYQHIHEYWQQNNPGPYVAEGYSLFPQRSAPAKEQDLALPSLDEVKARILARLKFVQSVRPLLDKSAGRKDASALTRFLEERSKSRAGCTGNDAIAERITEQIRSLNDPELLLKIQPIAPGVFFPVNFIRPAAGEPDKSFAAARVKFLIRTLSDTKKDLPLRVGAVEILLQLSKFHSSPVSGPGKPLPIDNEWLESVAGEIRSTARTIFDAESENGRLRGLCLQFLDLGEPENVADVRRVYARTPSQELRFDIEEALLDASDALYESLHPPGGPVASLVALAPEAGCQKAAAGKIMFVADYDTRQDFFEQSLSARRYFVLTDLRTGQRVILESQQTSNAGRRGQDCIEFSRSSDLRAGDYSLAFEYSHNGDIVSTGYKLRLAVTNTPAGKVLSAKPAN
ncbi:MAG TPA: hypothetical protein VKR61_05370 [Bryobacteraceae bacterium]|nr:hypothetical protein [Bryobacteraceae bacterium]